MVKKEMWGLHPETGAEIPAFWIENEEGWRVQILSLGSRVNQFWIRDEKGNPLNIVLGSPNPTSALSELGLYLSSTVGRVAGRIQEGFYWDKGKKIELTKTDGEKTLHGAGSLSRALWDLKEMGENFVSLVLISPDGEAGFLGSLEIIATFTLTGSALSIEYKATTDRDTPLSLSNHIYWNLNGKGSILDHSLQVDSDFYLPLDSENLPIGEIKSVSGTPFDLRSHGTLREQLGNLPESKGYDHSFVMAGNPSEPKACIKNTDKTLSLSVYTNQPTLHLYTGNYLAGTKLVDNRVAQDWSGFAIETQGFVNSLHTPHFPSIWLKRGEIYKNLTRFEINRS